MENKSKNTKIVLGVILVVILISVIGIAIFSISNKQKDENAIGKNEMTNSQDKVESKGNTIGNKTKNQAQNQTTGTTNNSSNNSNVIMPTESEKDEPERVVSTPGSGQDNVTGGGHTE